MSAIDEIVQKRDPDTYKAANIDYGGELGYGDDTEISSYDFDLCTNLRFGSNEGIYLEITMQGKWNENQNKESSTGKSPAYPTIKSIGLYKTLSDDIEAMKNMGALGGAIIYHGYEYINQNLDIFTPKKELEHFSQYPIALTPIGNATKTIILEQSKDNPGRIYATDTISKCFIVQKLKDGKSGWGEKWAYDYEARLIAETEGRKPELPVYVKSDKIKEVIKELEALGAKVEYKPCHKPTITETLTKCKEKADAHNANLPQKEAKNKEL